MAAQLCPDCYRAERDKKTRRARGGGDGSSGGRIRQSSPENGAAFLLREEKRFCKNRNILIKSVDIQLDTWYHIYNERGSTWKRKTPDGAANEEDQGDHPQGASSTVTARRKKNTR